MKRNLIDILKCPHSGEDLKLQIIDCEHDKVITGNLISSSHSYPISNGIPRFVKDEGYSNNFGWQWNRWSKIQFEEENVGRPMHGHTTNMFKKITELDEEKISGKKVLDIGCGPGRFVDISISLGAGLVVALDYSSAIDVAKENFSQADNILFIQGDALNLPFKEGVFDYAFSIGVLHHTPDPKKGVFEAYRILRNEGEFAISVYKKGGYYDFPSVQAWRKLFQVLWPLFGHIPPYLYSQIFGRLNYYLRKFSRPLSIVIKAVIPSVTLNDIRWSVLDTFDSVTPSYQSAHTVYEVYKWFKDRGFRSIRVAAWENIIGKK